MVVYLGINNLNISALFTQNHIQKASQSCMNPLLSPNSRIETYEDLVINLSISVQEELERKMDLLPREDKEIHIDLLLKAFDKPHLSDPIWKHPNFPLYALLALKEKKIDGMDFSTSQMFYNVINHPSNQGQIQEIPLFINDSINPRAWSLIEETMQSFISQKYKQVEEVKGMKKSSFQIIHPFMTSYQQFTFFKLVRKLRPLQQRFLLIPELEPLIIKFFIKFQQTGNLRHSIIDAINIKNPSFNVFCRISDKEFGKPLRMIPSKGMMQAYLFATGGDCTLISQFDFSSWDNLHKGISTDERAMALNFAFLPTITKADDRLCFERANEVEYHDFYHIDIMNLIRMDKSKFDGMADLIQILINENPNLKDALTTLYKQIIDMEHVDYRIFYSRRENSSDSQIEGGLFWAAICYKLDSIKRTYSQEFKQICQIIAKKLIEEADHYQILYKLNLEFILNLKSNLSKLLSPNLMMDFIHLKDFISILKGSLNFRGYTREQLLTLVEHQGSYLIRNVASKQLAKTFTLETIWDTLTQLKKKRVLTAYFNALDFIVKQFQNLVDHLTLLPKTKKLLFQELRNSPTHFEYLIKSAILENNIRIFDLLMGTNKEFIEKQLNRVFNDGLTLWQTAALKENTEMMEYLVSLGAKSVEKIYNSHPKLNLDSNVEKTIFPKAKKPKITEK